MESKSQAELGVVAVKKRKPRGRGKKAAEVKELLLNVSGDWMAAETLRSELVEAVGSYPKVFLNLADLGYVDASALQVLVAADHAGWFSAGKVELLHVSEDVKRCFAYSGAETLLAVEGEVLR